MGNGDVARGDGWRYRGRGPIQTTNRDNYAALNKALKLADVNFLVTPEKVAEPKYGALAASHYWNSHGLNELADTGTYSAITRRVNGSMNGLADRQERLRRTCTVLASLPRWPSKWQLDQCATSTPLFSACC
jgi:putative chitinase